MKKLLKTLGLIALIPAAIVMSYAVPIMMEVREKSARIRHEALESYGGDEVMALVQFVDDGSRRYGDRNHAIGMLAMLGDKRALPVLEKYYGNSREALNQYELERAIEAAREDRGMNILTRILR